MSDLATLSHPVPQAVRRNVSPVIEVRDLSLWYEEAQALHDVAFDLYPSEILAFVGPSGCGKTTALKCLNRMHDDTRGVRVSGSILMAGLDIHDPSIDPPLHRRRFGWVAQKPNPFPSSVWENVAYGIRIHGLALDPAELDAKVEACLRRAHLWDEVKDDMHEISGLDLSGGQQQRLCIARALSTEPEVLLMDEPTGSIDPLATAAIERMLLELKTELSVVIVTHSMAQATRIADRVAFFHAGRLLEIGASEKFFRAPVTAEARAFVAGLTG